MLGPVMIRSIAGVHRAFLRDLSGFDELSVKDTGTRTAIALLDRLISPQTETDLQPGIAADLSTSDRDILFGALYQRIYGSRVNGTVLCKTCRAPFDVDFLVPNFLQHLGQQNEESDFATRIDDQFELANGCRFRLPSGRDEMAIIGLSQEEAESVLVTRCIVSGDPEENRNAVEQAMRQLATIASGNIIARCPECDKEQPIYFDLQHYFLTAIQQERQQLRQEIHYLATAYGWTLTEILGLARKDRQALVELIETDRARSE